MHVTARDCGDWRDLPVRGLMKSQGYVAISAAQDVFAGGAEYEVAVATAVEEHDCLLVSGECFRELICQRLAHQLRREIFHIDESHFGVGEVHHAFWQAGHIEELFFCC